MAGHGFGSSTQPSSPLRSFVRNLALLGMTGIAIYGGALYVTSRSDTLGVPATTPGSSGHVTSISALPLHISRFPTQPDQGVGGAHAGTIPSAAAVIKSAHAQLGAPYAWVGEDPKTGFSCIGLIYYIYDQNGVFVPYNLNDAYLAAPRIAREDLQPGDVVFFFNTVFPGISHAALYIGNDTMIGADTPTTGVEIDHLSDQYWTEHYYGATRPLANPDGHRLFQPGDETGSQPAQDAMTRDVLAYHTVGMSLVPRASSVAVFSGPGYTYQDMQEVTTTLTVASWQGVWYQVRITDPSGWDVYGWVAAQDVMRAASSDFANPATIATPSVNVSAFTSGSDATTMGSHTVAAIKVPGWASVTANSVNLRAGPTTVTHVIETLPRGLIVRVNRKQNDWFAVVTPHGVQGWVNGHYVIAAQAPATTQ